MFTCNPSTKSLSALRTTNEGEAGATFELFLVKKCKNFVTSNKGWQTIGLFLLKKVNFPQSKNFGMSKKGWQEPPYLSHQIILGDSSFYFADSLSHFQ